MSLRERALLAAFLWLCIAIWVGTASRSFRETKVAFTKVTTEMETQSLWLEKREETETRLNKALDLVDPRKTYASSQLVGKLDTIARDTNMNFDINSPTTKTGDIFDVHTVRIQFKKAGLADLIVFDEKVKKESPYLGLERVQIIANKGDPRFLDAQFVVSSFELKDKTL